MCENLEHLRHDVYVLVLEKICIADCCLISNYMIAVLILFNFIPFLNKEENMFLFDKKVKVE